MLSAKLLQSSILLSYLIRNGSERVVTSSREHLYDLRNLESYTFIDEHGNDQGQNGMSLTPEWSLVSVQLLPTVSMFAKCGFHIGYIIQ